jgi:predicted dienelactone hydrolase
LTIGFRTLELDDAGLRIPVWLLYPTEAPESAMQLGPYEIQVARDAPPIDEPRKLVAYSHGNGATPWAARNLLFHLVRRGFAVVAIEHPGNNRHDNSLSTPDGLSKLANLEHRPRHTRLAIDAAFAHLRLHPEVAVAGHSIGGYTALALAGGHAMTLPEDVPHAKRLDPDAETIARAFAVTTERDPRVTAAILLGPALGWFDRDGALADVTASLFVRAGEKDPICPAHRIQHALRGVAMDFQIVPNAGHFSFLSPFPAAMANAPPARDPPGFDRESYQHVLAEEIVAFLGSR